uniref:Uncharacterized protein n=1 Tax=Anguilla anguilla TaxID=7936 RepID=A0A0E9R8D0_ANGAN
MWSESSLSDKFLCCNPVSDMTHHNIKRVHMSVLEKRILGQKSVFNSLTFH